MKLFRFIKNLFLKLFRKKSASAPAPTVAPRRYTKGACIRRNACGHVVEMSIDTRPTRGAFGRG